MRVVSEEGPKRAEKLLAALGFAVGLQEIGHGLPQGITVSPSEGPLHCDDGLLYGEREVRVGAEKLPGLSRGLAHALLGPPPPSVALELVCGLGAHSERSSIGSPSSRPATRDRGTSSPRSSRASLSYGNRPKPPPQTASRAATLLRAFVRAFIVSGGSGKGSQSS